MESADVCPRLCRAPHRGHRDHRLEDRVQRHARLSLHFPLVSAGNRLGMVAAHLAAAFCTFLSDWLDPFPMDMQVPRDILIFSDAR